MQHHFFDVSPLTDADAFVFAQDDSNRPRQSLTGVSSVQNEERDIFQSCSIGLVDYEPPLQGKGEGQTYDLIEMEETLASSNESLRVKRDVSCKYGAYNDVEPTEDGLDEPDSPCVNDVIFGKGGRSKHPGNETFRRECQRLAPQWLDRPTKKVRHELVLELVGFVYLKGGRFLVEDSNQKGSWNRAGFDLACKKAKQLLADTTKKMKKDKK